MAREKFLPRDRISDWLGALGRERRLFVPRKEGGSIVLRPFRSGEEGLFGVDLTGSAKTVIFPACQELFSYGQTKDRENPESTLLKLYPSISAEPTAVFGIRPCNAKGFNVFDRVYLGERFPDPYYQSARENTVFVTLACERVDNTCFCNWVGGGPDDTSGSDVLMTPVRGGFVAEAISGKGAVLLDTPLMGMAEGELAEAEAVRAKAKKDLGPAPEMDLIMESIRGLFDDLRFWEHVSDKCISCGACTYLCPTCYCFNISDEAYGLTGRRLRSWDTCMSFQFTLEASGHNPRPTKAHRLRNRIGHKFGYFPALHCASPACCGCGRCIRNCPAGVDIREILLEAIGHAKGLDREVANE